MSKYKLIIFDFDGTVCATHNAITHCFAKTFNKYNKTTPKYETLYDTITKGVGLEDSFRLLNSDLKAKDDGSSDKKTDTEQKTDSVKEWVETYREYYKTEGEDKASLFDGAKEVFEYLHSIGISIVVVSNKGIDAVNSALKRFKLAHYVSLVVGDTKDIKKKPDPMIFDKIIKPKFNDISLGEILMIGDTMADLLFAKNIGTDSCWASYGYGLKEECESISPTHIIKGLADIKAIISDLKNTKQCRILQHL